VWWVSVAFHPTVYEILIVCRLAALSTTTTDSGVSPPTAPAKPARNHAEVYSTEARHRGSYTGYLTRSNPLCTSVTTR